MPAPDFIALFTGPLEKLGAPYMITGATAAILHGRPRLTKLGKDQFTEYAARKGQTLAETGKWQEPYLDYDPS
jgi:hypothetical protein